MLPLTLHLTTAFTKHLLLTMGLPDSSVGRESTCNVGDPGLIPGLGRSTGEGIGYPLQYAWAFLLAQLFPFFLQCGKPGFDPWVGNIPWRRESLPTPVFWPGKLHRQSRESQSWTPLSDFHCIFCILEYSELDYILTSTNLLYLLSYDN